VTPPQAFHLRMIMMHSYYMILLLTFLALPSQCAEATVIPYTNKASWQSAAGAYTTIDFTGYPDGTIIADLYAPLGIHFTDGIDQIWNNGNAFPNDAWGLNGAFDSTTVEFDVPIHSIAIDFPGIARIKLYSEGRLIYTSPEFAGIVGVFGGLISTEPFDKAVLYDPFGGFFVDTLYFGPPIPVPGALAILGLAGLMCSQKRRRDS
jgi:hypothetical protein